MARLQPRGGGGGGRLGSHHHHHGSKNGGGGRGGAGTAASAASGRGKPNRPTDVLHNGEQPCCQELALQCRQVLEAVQTKQPQLLRGGAGTDGGSSTSSSALPTLPELVAAYLSDAVASMRLDHSPSAAAASASPAGLESGHREGANGDGGGGPSDAATATAAAGKKKKSKKKKKKAKKAVSSSAAASTSASSVSATDEGGEEEGDGGGGEGINDHVEDEEEQDNDDHDRGGHPADGPRGKAAASVAVSVSVASNAADDDGMGAQHSDLPSYSTSEFHPPSPSLFDMMAQDYFAEAAAKRTAAPPPPNGSKMSSSSASKTTAGPTNRKAPQSSLPKAAAARSHEAFWDRLLVESKRFQVRKGAVTSALDQIACPRCRRHVADVLEGTHKIRIHSSYDRASHGAAGGPPSHHLSVAPSSPWDYHDPNDHRDRDRHRPSPMAYSDESYRQLEEGTLDDVAANWFREQRHDLSFQFTVCHDDDEEMAWKLRGMGLDDDLADDDVENDNDDNNVDDDSGIDEANSSHKKKRKGAKAIEPDVVAAKAALRSGGIEDWRKYVLYHYLLGRGVAADDLVRPTAAEVDNANETHNGAMADPDFSADASINPGLVRNMASSARSTVSGYQATLNECAASLKAQEELLIQHDEQYLGGGELNMVVFPILKEADQMCCRTVSLQQRILSELSQWLFMSATAVRGEEAPLWLQTDLSNMQDTVLAMWELWLQATQVIVLEIAHYESLTRKIATRNGQFVNPFSSSTYRKLYRDLVRTKLGAAKCLVEQMRDLLDTPLEVPGINPLDRKASVASKLVTSGIFCQHFWGFNYKQQPPPTQLDEDMRGVLDSIRECVETTHRGTWMEVQDEHENRRQQLSRRIDRVVTESNHLGCAGSVIRRLLLGSATTAQRSVEDDSSHIFEAELDPSIRYRESLKEIGMQMVAGWIRERCHQRSNDEPTIPIMPSALSIRLVNGLHDVSCCFNAKTRAACILVSMFYRWMSDQCDAWRAELVAQELLTSIAEAEADQTPPGSDGATVSGTSKAVKKKKKKANDGPSLRTTPKLEGVGHVPPSSSDNVERGAGPSSAQANVLHATGSDEVPSASSSPAPIDDASMIAEEVQEIHGKSTRWRHENELSTQNGHHLSVALKESVVQDEAARDFVLSNQDEVEAERMRLVDSVSALDAFVSIGVDCESAFESAEEFLVGRLMSILKPVAQEALKR